MGVFFIHWYIGQASHLSLFFSNTALTEALPLKAPHCTLWPFLTSRVAATSPVCVEERLFVLLCQRWNSSAVFGLPDYYPSYSYITNGG